MFLMRSSIFSRYSDRVETETERLNQLELDDLEVTYQSVILFAFRNLYQLAYSESTWEILDQSRWMRMNGTIGS